MTKISFNRSIFDYHKIQVIIGNCIRNKNFQVNKKLLSKKYLDVGCGLNTHNNYVNLDYSWTPKIEICWDLTKKKLPFNNNSFEGIFTEHCLEHISLEECEKTIKEFYRLIKPGGILRIIVPDGELYFDLYQQKKQDEKIQMPYEEGYISPMSRINGLFRKHGHKFIYDFNTMKIILEKNGFKNVIKTKFRIGKNVDLLIDSESRSIESLYVEAEK